MKQSFKTGFSFAWSLGSVSATVADAAVVEFPGASAAFGATARGFARDAIDGFFSGARAGAVSGACSV